MKRLLIMLSLLVVLLFLGLKPSYKKAEVIKGMTISCQTWGWEWGTDAMVDAMKELKTLGINWISIHPYAGISRDGTVRFRRGRSNENVQWLTRPIEEAHRLGLKILIKPHLSYWRSGYSWRGELEFKTDEEWNRFFTTYSQWIEDLAVICKNADAFVVGTELDKTIHYESRWREIIQILRENFSAPITYAANWTDYERIPFWDALDVIGIQAYFPLLDPSVKPNKKLLETSWKIKLKELNQFAETHNRPIVFTEIGYDVSTYAPYKPWETGDYRPGAEEIQKLCLSAALEALSKDDQVIGAFLWKWFAGETRHADFLKSTPAMRKVIKDNWGE